MILVVTIIVRFVSARLSRYRQHAISVMMIGWLLAGVPAARAQVVPPTPGAPDDAAQLRRLVEELQKRVAELEARAQQQTSLASKPASTAALETLAPAPAQVTPARLMGLDDDWAARLANMQISGTLSSQEARDAPNAIDRANADWKAAHPEEKATPVISVDVRDVAKGVKSVWDKITK